MNSNSNIGIQFNMQQMLNMLSASLYKDSVLRVATRELLQNSFDAVKHRPDPRIDVRYSDRVLEFKDNGIGMSPDTVRNVFFTIGGTAKEGLDPSERSGGFGIAKVQFFMAAEHLHVESVRDGVKTIVPAPSGTLSLSSYQMKDADGNKVTTWYVGDKSYGATDSIDLTGDLVLSNKNGA